MMFVLLQVWYLFLRLRTQLATRAVSASVAAVFMLSQAFAVEWRPFPNQRVTSMNGRFYVVARRIGGPYFELPFGPVEMQIVAKQNDTSDVAPIVEPIEDVEIGMEPFRYHYNMSRRAKAITRPTDTIIGRHIVAMPPVEVHISGNACGVVLIGTHGALPESGADSQAAICLLDPRGGVVRKWSYAELFQGLNQADIIYDEIQPHWLWGAAISDVSNRLLLLVRTPEASYPSPIVLNLDESLATSFDAKAISEVAGELVASGKLNLGLSGLAAALSAGEQISHRVVHDMEELLQGFATQPSTTFESALRLGLLFAKKQTASGAYIRSSLAELEGSLHEWDDCGTVSTDAVYLQAFRDTVVSNVTDITSAAEAVSVALWLVDKNRSTDEAVMRVLLGNRDIAVEAVQARIEDCRGNTRRMRSLLETLRN